jgi:ribA/ribD-fused uncharacterized protein
MKFRNENWFMSNMYPCNIKWKGKVYKSVETIFQMEKCAREEDREKFVMLNGFEAKKLGRRVILRNDWHDVRVDIMRDILIAKFDGELHNKLLTIKGEIVEDNNWGDRMWGRCNGVGENMLGKLLMELRDNRSVA